MKRKYFAPVLFVCFCLTIIFWINYAAKNEDCVNVGGGTYLVETTTKYIVAESDTLLNGKHYVQVIDAANKKVNVVSYICHIIYFLTALAIFVLMLIILDITKED
ncbi:hypothetical protein [Bacteroidaceae bacterium]|jgi:hypothetical protein